MFDAITHDSERRSRRLGAGTLLSLGLHAGLLLAALLLPSREPPPPPEPPQPVFLMPQGPKGPAAPPGPAAPRAEAPRPAARPRARRARAITPPRQVPPPVAEVPQLPTLPPLPIDGPEAQEGSEGVEEATAEGGPPGAVGCVGVHCTGSGPGGGGGGEVVFGPGMTRPVRLSGEDPSYTREAREAGVEGMLVVRCTITSEGRLEDCRVIKGLPHMDAEVLRALSTHRYSPVTFQGRPVRVGYVFNVRLRLPD